MTHNHLAFNCNMKYPHRDFEFSRILLSLRRLLQPSFYDSAYHRRRTGAFIARQELRIERGPRVGESSVVRGVERIMEGLSTIK